MPRTNRKAVCPGCGHQLDGATKPDDEKLKPKGGDVSVCMYCASISFFNADLTLRLVSQEELDGFEPKLLAELKQMVSVIKELRSSGTRARRT